MIAESTFIRPFYESLFHRPFTGLSHPQHSKSISQSLASRRSSLTGRHENAVLADNHEAHRMPNLASSTLSDIPSSNTYPQSSSSFTSSSEIAQSGSNSETSNGAGRDPQAFDPFNSDQMKDEDLWHFRNGPLPGDLAEVEAFCRIFRVAEQVHKAVMEALRVVSDSREHVDEQYSDTNGAATYGANQDIPLLEEKVVSSLACIGALLHQQKQEVLTGRFGLGSTTIAGFNSIPPLAQFRANMKRCCEQLEALLLCYFPVDDPQFTVMHKKFQKLQNICFDAGHPRVEGSPSHADIPNWGPVHSQTQNKEIERDVAFWRGGQLTDDGINWLVDKGFKVVVDLRGEDTGHHLAKSALAAAVSSGKLKHIELPVERGSIPSKKQVIEFSKIVMNIKNRPLYLHSQEGVGRTSAMVAKWRETGFMTVAEENIANVSSSEDDATSNGPCIQNPSRKNVISDVSVDTSTGQKAMKKEGFPHANPFEAQRPPPNVFSRIEMSKFFKGRQVTPTSFKQNNSRRTIVTVIQGDESVPSTVGIEEPAGRWGLDGPGIPRAGKKGEIEKEKEPISAQNASALRRVSENGALHENDDVMVVGDMCASTTGVVRVQSRKKAEMYLVRTDGFSCTRERVKESTLAFTHPSTQQQMLMWKTPPKTVLLLKKLGPELMQEAELVASFLHHKEGMNVIVEPDVHDHFARVSGFGFVQTFYNQDISLLHERVDFVVCLGGDGVILHASNLFRDAVPPVVSFNLGSLGFLTAHPFEDFMQDLRAIIHGNTSVEGVYITLRMRLRCEISRNGKPVPGKIFDVLNEVVVDRGSNPYLCKIECYERNRLITKVQADGVIIATPTGSTAYSTAAGGSMVHPNVPCMLFTPICPHSLSFRPVILPDSALLELKVPEDARSNAWVSFDGKKRQQLSRGDSVRICMSEHPLPTINKSDQTDDWFQSLVRCLNWNERLEQKPLPSHIRE